MYAAGGGDGYLTMAETALARASPACSTVRRRVQHLEQEEQEIAFALHLENGSIRRAATSPTIWGSTQIKASTATLRRVPVSSNQWFSTRTTSSGSSSGARSWATSGPM
ncbi:MAG: hypothetical protein ACLRM8_06355 [Alistipes sp.]